MKFDPLKAAEIHAKESSAELINAKMQEDWRGCIKYTDYTFGDGVPQTKYFDRNDEIKVRIRKDDPIVGIYFRGKLSGCAIFQFFHDDVWYEASWDDAAEILQLLGKEVDGSDPC